jgi:hypothetical protein
MSSARIESRAKAAASNADLVSIGKSVGMMERNLLPLRKRDAVCSR